MKIKDIRNRTGFNQGEFAEYFGIPIRSLQEWEQERKNPPPYLCSLLERILDAEDRLARRKKRMTTVKGTIEKVIADKGNWCCIMIHTGKQAILCVGNIPSPYVGAEIVLKDYKQVSHPKYGMQYQVTSCQIHASTTSIDGIKGYLTSGFVKGIGEKTADAIVDKFGTDTIRILNEEPERLLEIKGVSEKKLEKITESHKLHSKYAEIVDLFGGEVTVNAVRKLYEEYGEDTVTKLRENPYQIIYAIDGFGFKKVDKLARSMGIAADSECRIRAAIIFLLTDRESSGDCYMTIPEIESQMRDLILEEDDEDLTKKEIEALKNWEECRDDFAKSAKLTPVRLAILDHRFDDYCALNERVSDILAKMIKEEEELVAEDGVIYEANMHQQECSVASILKMMLKDSSVLLSEEEIGKVIEQTEMDQGITFEEHQRRAIVGALTHRVSVITGGPGTGKTTIIRAILEGIKKAKAKSVLLAPTGKAAKRLAEATGKEASTIHSLLYGSRQDETIDKNTMVIVDETSMCDIHLMYALLKKANKGRFLFVGDVDQLPSVGPGSVLRDFTDTLPTVRLTFSHRFGGTIGFNAGEINKGYRKTLIFDSTFTLSEKDAQSAAEEVVKQYNNLRKTYEKSEICILCPMRKVSNPAGSINLNRMIQDAVNPSGKQIMGIRAGDRVIQTRNDYRHELLGGDMGVYNGDTGTVVSVSEDDEVLVSFDDGRSAYYDRLQMEDLQLAYAMTIHKSQGSEYKAVIIVSTTNDYIMLQRNLLYTAVTRAKERVVLVGDTKAFNMAIRNNTTIARKSRLKDRIRI